VPEVPKPVENKRRMNMKEKIGTSGKKSWEWSSRQTASEWNIYQDGEAKRDRSDERVVLQINLETSSSRADWSRWAEIQSSEYWKRLKSFQFVLYILLGLDRALC